MMVACNVQITLDLVALALYDVVLYCDDSGSMAFEEGVGFCNFACIAGSQESVNPMPLAV